jgi:hypothetical protein
MPLTFGDLRSIIHQNADRPQRWHQLRRALDALPEDPHLREQLLHYLQDIFDREDERRDLDLVNLRQLILRFNDLGDDTARYIAASPNLISLTHLDLSHNKLTDEGAIALSKAPNLTKLHTLLLAHNHRITPRGARALRQSEHLPQHLRDQWAELANTYRRTSQDTPNDPRYE